MRRVTVTKASRRTRFGSGEGGSATALGVGGGAGGGERAVGNGGGSDCMWKNRAWSSGAVGGREGREKEGGRDPTEGVCVCVCEYAGIKKGCPGRAAFLQLTFLRHDGGVKRI